MRKGDFIDAIFYCPYDIHELVSIAAIRQQRDRNIRMLRGTMLKKI